MSMLDAFFAKGFKAAKCKTLLKLTIPRIKLLRNRREIQLKQMRRDIAKLLETGQEATARIRVEHIIREEKMMAAQEILELFCELISVRLPIIEAQRECPIDLKEAISSVCFAAPRCADLPELLQVQMLFASKYGKEFVAAAAELMPDCGVNRQIIELLSVRAPSPEAKLKLLKEIAEEHELDWDPAASESELFKSHEDLLNGSTQFGSGSKLPLPKEKHDDSLYSTPDHALNEQPDSDTGFDSLDFPEVPKVSVWPNSNAASAPEIIPPNPVAASPTDDRVGDESSQLSGTVETLSLQKHVDPEEVVEEHLIDRKDETANGSVDVKEDKQFLPFISPPSLSSASFSARESAPPSSLRRTKSNSQDVDLQDVLAAAQAAAESAERAAAAARSAASLAQVRITEITRKKSAVLDDSDNPFYAATPESANAPTPELEHIRSLENSGQRFDSLDDQVIHKDLEESGVSNQPPPEEVKFDTESLVSSHKVHEYNSEYHQPERSTSMDEPYFSYPNLFSSKSIDVGSGSHSVKDNLRPNYDP
ncbi:uncharacterized protein LOC115668431 [Syzygium oleosum]|uniref:uncharacterized protein LOC115668431 n=1 Tax=Syzygium oleosum TaxID=219896 RepID=UPI0024B915E9|nr:uncharacterized protein LOC115668431 [Syzygium oleosum]